MIGKELEIFILFVLPDAFDMLNILHVYILMVIKNVRANIAIWLIFLCAFLNREISWKS